MKAVFTTCRRGLTASLLLFLTPGLAQAQDNLPTPAPPLGGTAGTAAGAEGGAATALSTDEAITSQFDEAVVRAAELRSRIEGKVISLDRAMRITLARQPSIRLSAEDLEIARAAVILAAAPFDLTVVAEARHGRIYRPRTPSELRQEIAQQMQAQLDAQRAVNNQQVGVAQSAVSANLADSLTNQALALDLLAGTFPLFTTPAATTGAGSQALLAAQQIRLAQLQQQLDNLGPTPLDTTTRVGQSNYSVGATKFTRSGVTIAPRLDWDRNAIENTGSVNLDIFIPLGQGRGAVTERALEDSAIVDVDASKWQLRHEIATALINTTISYWNLVAAQQDYGLLTDSEDVARTFDELTALRLEKEEISAGEAAIASSRLADAVSQRIGAEFAVYQARQQLALAMGFQGEELVEPPFAAGDLPPAVGMGHLSGLNHGQLLRKALLLRDDQRSAVQLVRSGKILAKAAKFDVKPVVDLFFNFAFTGVDEGTQFSDTFSAFGNETTGLGAFGGFTMQWPLKLSASRAAYHQSAAIFRQRRISAMDLERVIASGVNTAVAQTISTRQQIDAASRSSGFSRRALGAERARYDAGESNLLDSIQLEQTYTQSLRNLIVARLGHSISVSSLRFETGTLLDPSADYGPEKVTFSAANLTRIPNWKALPDSPVVPVEVDFDKKPRPLLKRGLRHGDDDLTDAASIEAEARHLAAAPAGVETAVVAPAPVAEAAAPEVLLPVRGQRRPAAPSLEVAPVEPAAAAEAPAPAPPVSSAPAPRARAGKPQPLLKKLFKQGD